MNILRHCWWAVRYGEWYCDWIIYENKPMLGFYHTYYDGNWASLHIYKLCISVHY